LIQNADFPSNSKDEDKKGKGKGKKASLWVDKMIVNRISASLEFN
jgi:hypothetical protein